jgi:hypothetical protein
MLIAVIDQGNLIGFSVGPRDSDDLIVNHLLFAADTLIFLWCTRTNSTFAVYLLMLCGRFRNED